MKKIIVVSIFSMVAFTAILRGQSDPDPVPEGVLIERMGSETPFSQRMKEMIVPLDKSLINTGMLSDLSFILSPMDEFEGKVNPTATDLPGWKKMYRQLYNATLVEGSLVSPLFQVFQHTMFVITVSSRKSSCPGQPGAGSLVGKK